MLRVSRNLSKNHEPNFQNNPTVRLLNPAKNELGRINKTILDKINVNLRNSLHLNGKTHKKLSIGSKTLTINNIISLSCLTSDFHPSISKELLTDALTFAETIISMIMIRRLYTTPVKSYFSIKNRRG